jgi:hypothetical protein
VATAGGYCRLYHLLVLRVKVLVKGVETMGLEPTTPCLQSRCTTNCATSPGRYPHATSSSPASRPTPSTRSRRANAERWFAAAWRRPGLRWRLRTLAQASP